MIQSSTALQLLSEQVVDDLRVGLALRGFHHLSDEEAEESLLAAAVLLQLLRAGREDFVDDALDLARVARLRDAALGDDRRGALPRPKHHGEHVLALRAADPPLVDEA